MGKKRMNKKNIYSKLAVIIICISFVFPFIAPTSATEPFHSVYGFVYINDILAPSQTEVLITFDDGEESDIIDISNGYYQIDWQSGNHEHEWPVPGGLGYFSVIYDGDSYIPIDNMTIKIYPEIIGYEVDLYITTLGSPPYEPTNPQPENNSENVSINPTLSVYVSDPDEDIMDVSFYDATDDSLIGTDLNVPSGGTASIVWSNLNPDTEYFWYSVANDSIYETKSEVWNFKTKIMVNQPPDKPTNPLPADGAEDVELDTSLSVDVTDPDDDSMDVLFFDAFDDSLIGTDLNVASGGTASIEWNDLSYNTTYSWYAIADDTMYETKSDTWSFTTILDIDDTPPIVSITKPQKGLYIFNNKILPRFIRPALIIGSITIEANAKDAESGIEKVEFYICGELKGNDTTAPYTFDWKWDRIRLFHIFIIKVVAYNYEGMSSFDSMIVRKFL
jgi:hypothetical protein